jgi:hypothetical protein
MSKRLILLLAITAVNVAVVLLVVASSRGPSPARSRLGGSDVAVTNNAVLPAVAEDVFKTRVQPFVAKYCIGCHGPEKQKADLALHGYKDQHSVLRGRKVWLNVAKMVHEGEMPSGKGAMPSPEEREWFVKWIDTTLNDIDCSKRDPGRVTIRRLNRVEYNNTVRDLLGVTFTPADDFPSDDVGYGFDNIGDVLSMPPVLLEKYLKAAEQVAKAAVNNDPGRKPARARRYEGEQFTGGQGGAGLRMLMTEGDITVEIDTRRDGEYELRVKAYQHRAGPDNAKMAVLLDDKILKEFEVKGEEKEPAEFAVKTQIARGKHKAAIRYLNNFNDPKIPDAKHRDRNLIIHYLEVAGPLDEKPAAPSAQQIFTRLPNEKGEDWRECAAEILARQARRAYRRPAIAAEVDKLVRFVELVRGEGGSFDQGIELALQAMLVSPHFLFRIEVDPEPTNPDKVRTLNDHELAVRLSYFLWSSMPDEELFSLAEKGTLRQPAVLEKQIRSMVQDPRAAAMVKSFAGQWLQLRSLERITPDAKAFPDFDNSLRQSMLRETELFFEAVVKEDRSVLDFLDGRFTFVNGRLARHYGIADIKGDEFQRVELVGTQRSGILTQASILTITSNPTRTSPVLRGKYVLEEILGTPPPPPPPDVPELPEGDKGELVGSLRQRLEQHRANAVCASCHSKMDPIGFGLENYDGIGKWRTADGKHPIDSTGVMPTGESFKTSAELKKMLLDRKQQFSRTLSEKMLTFALGRGLEYYDKCAVDDIVKAMQKSDYRFSALVMAIVQSDPFTKRRGKTAEEP